MQRYKNVRFITVALKPLSDKKVVFLTQKVFISVISTLFLEARYAQRTEKPQCKINGFQKQKHLFLIQVIKLRF